MKKCQALACLLIIWISIPALAKERKLMVFAAASLTEVTHTLVDNFSQKEKVKVKLNLASSGQLARQIVMGAKADIYLSADLKWLTYLEEKNIISDTQSHKLCQNRLALIGSEKFSLNSIDVDNPDLKIGELFEGKLTIGNPDHVPGGKYALEFLKNSAWYNKLKDRLLPCVTIRSALMLIEMNQWQMGIVFYSDYAASKKVKLLAEIPSDMHSPIIYGYAIITDNELSRKFQNYLNSPKARKILQEHSFLPIKHDNENGDS
ncbi:MAG: molybdate ABC transporter substrate-binding protein [Candidatus Rifleibacteriota bacterium]